MGEEKTSLSVIQADTAALRFSPEQEALQAKAEQEVVSRLYHLKVILDQTEDAEQRERFQGLIQKAEAEQEAQQKWREEQQQYREAVRRAHQLKVSQPTKSSNWISALALTLTTAGLAFLLWQSNLVASSSKNLAEARLTTKANAQKAASLSVDTVSLPDLTGMTETEAQTALEEAGLALGQVTAEASQTVEAGRIIASKQGVGAKLSRGTAVDLTLSSGFEGVALGDYAGQSYTEAVANLAALGVPAGQIITEEAESADQEPGTVLEQSLTSGSFYDLANPVTLTLKIAKPVSRISLPDLTGYTFAEAVEALTSLGIPAEKISASRPGASGAAVIEGQSILPYTELVPAEAELVLYLAQD